jgi:hypothetical protein
MEIGKDGGAEDSEDAAVHITQKSQQKHGNTGGPLTQCGLGLDMASPDSASLAVPKGKCCCKNIATAL